MICPSPGTDVEPLVGAMETGPVPNALVASCPVGPPPLPGAPLQAYVTPFAAVNFEPPLAQLPPAGSTALVTLTPSLPSAPGVPFAPSLPSAPGVPFAPSVPSAP